MSDVTVQPAGENPPVTMTTDEALIYLFDSANNTGMTDAEIWVAYKALVSTHAADLAEYIANLCDQGNIVTLATGITAYKNPSTLDIVTLTETPAAHAYSIMNDVTETTYDTRELFLAGITSTLDDTKEYDFTIANTKTIEEMKIDLGRKFAGDILANKIVSYTGTNGDYTIQLPLETFPG